MWATRMDHYLKTGDEKIHFAAILLSLGIVTALVFILAKILKRGLNNDFFALAKDKILQNKRRKKRARLPPS